MRFDNKCALVTGGGSGIGRAVCLAFAREGADVGVADVSLEGAEVTAQEVRKSGGKAVALRVDVTDPASVQAMVNQAVAALGRIDLLVNSAGVREIVPFLQLPFAEWQRVIATNLTGTFLCSQAVAQYLVAQGRAGKIVNLASVAGLMAVPNRAAYVSSKHAVVGLTKEMAMELADQNIQVNAVAPGVVRTSMTESYFDKAEIVEGLKRAHPAGRWAQPEEIANLILFLASPEADFITGATFPIDGGFMAGKTF
ncbi:MAG TPA: 3-oxoacyl-ACP reductase family protein [Candidatus Binatia bacterium]|jgi:meso-butanediol dehydrogenase/(S,S)-butanediol dehydrogenase/diacetyl reductase|nr:3-oxoacyl-ACP reductase family protein [Candidatus Binatia bacterium]